MNKLKLGFLTVQGEEENHSQMMGGVFEVAEKNDVNVIRFASRVYYEDYNRYNSELHNLYKVIEAQKLDGLMFLGWMPGLIGPFFEDFKKMFKDIPLVSLGVNVKDIPNVYADSKQNIIDLMAHLILVHGYKNIVFMPPSYPDIRIQIYTEVMKKSGLFREELIIRDDLLHDIPFRDRMKRALAILIDERKVDIDAILVMFDTDAQNAYIELKARGLSIPGDIAIASNEDTEFAKYSLPPLTVLTFPWREVGYHGCEKLIQLIHHQEIEFSTGISGKMIIRNSCGCRSNSVKLSKIEARREKFYSSDTLNYKHILLFSTQIQKAFPYTLLNIDNLLSALSLDFERETSTAFFKEFEDELQSIVNKYPYRDSVEEIEETIYLMRNLILPFVSAKSEIVILFEDILHKSTILIREKFDFIIGYDNIEMNAINQELHFISQDLSSTFNIKKLMIVLENSLDKLKINSCYVFIAANEAFEEFTCVLKYADGIRLTNDDGNVTPGYISDEIVEKHPRLLCQLLRIEEDYLGFIVFEPSILDARIYEKLSLHISNALKSALLLEKLSKEVALRKEKEEQLTHIANYDTLTDLYNRRYFNRALHYLLDNAGEHPEEKLRIYLMFIDFDDFKLVNDKLGHDIGDLLIIEIAAQFKEIIRPYSYHIPDEISVADENGLSEAVFRLGGDEFTAILAGLPKKEVEMIATQLIDTVKTTYMIEGNEIHLSCSVGISCYPDQADTVEKLIKCADRAMYFAKEEKNRYCFFEDVK